MALLPNKKVTTCKTVTNEGHLLETEIIKFRGLSIYNKRWKKYMQNFKMTDYGYNDIGKWIEFLIDIETNMLNLPGEESLTETLALKNVRSNTNLTYQVASKKRIRIIEHQKE